MTRFLPIGLLFLATAAQAQNIESVATHRPASNSVKILADSHLPDSLATIERHPENGQKMGVIAQYDLANFITVEPLLTQAAGVQVTPYSGAPGTLSMVRIRGAVGIAGNPQPLYLLDDVPVFQNLGTAQVPFTRSAAAIPPPDGLLDLDPLLSVPTADIESITVLKGALETARYGAQGQYGVISIRTKAGRLLSPLRVSYSGSGGVQQVRKRYDLLSARQFGELANETDINNRRSPRYSPGELAALGAGTDWQREVLRTASTQEHHLSLSGGRAATRYYVAADYLKQNGLVLNSMLQRVALRANVEHQLSQRLALTATLGLSQLTARRAPDALVRNTLTAPPTGFPYLPNGQFAKFDYYEDNPVRQALEETREPRQRQLLGRLALRYTFNPYLQASILGHWEQNNLLQTWHLPDYQAPDTHYADQRDNNQFRQATVLAALDFSRTLAVRHAFVARLEGNWQDFRDDKSYVLVDNQLTSVNTATYALRATLLGPAVQAGYTYAGRYQLQGNFRLDKSTAQPLGDVWQPAFGGQATWHLGQENFLHQLSWLNALNLWAGYGRTSNAGNFFDLSQLRTVLLPSGTITSPLPVLERVAQLETGLSVQFRQHFSLEATAYQRQTTPDSPVFRAFGMPPPDYGVRNRGLELSAGAIWAGPEWRTTTRAAAAFQQNVFHAPLNYRFSNIGIVTTAGQPLSSFLGRRYQGVDATGQPRYQSTNGTSFLDTQPLGSGLPRCLLNFTQSLGYKRWDVQLQADAMLGYQLYDYSLTYLDQPSGDANSTTRVLDRWLPSRPTASVPAAGEAVEFGTYQLQSGSHARLSSLQVSYRLWEQGAHQVSVWVGGRNLLVVSDYRGFDPNVSSGGAAGTVAGLDDSAYPVPRTWLAGVRASF